MLIYWKGRITKDEEEERACPSAVTPKMATAAGFASGPNQKPGGLYSSPTCIAGAICCCFAQAP